MTALSSSGDPSQELDSTQVSPETFSFSQQTTISEAEATLLSQLSMSDQQRDSNGITLSQELAEVGYAPNIPDFERFNSPIENTGPEEEAVAPVREEIRPEQASMSSVEVVVKLEDVETTNATENMGEQASSNREGAAASLLVQDTPPRRRRGRKRKTATLSAEEKLAKKRARNKVLAKESRERRKVRNHQMEERNIFLEDTLELKDKELEKLKKENRQLKKENKMLKEGKDARESDK